VCMNAGNVIAAGDIHAVLKDHDVIEAYLGEPAEGEPDAGLELAAGERRPG
jgi:hypothetical protein